MHDINGRKDLIEHGYTGAQEEVRYQVAYHTYLGSGEQLLHTIGIEFVVEHGSPVTSS